MIALISNGIYYLIATTLLIWGVSTVSTILVKESMAVRLAANAEAFKAFWLPEQFPFGRLTMDRWEIYFTLLGGDTRAYTRVVGYDMHAWLYWQLFKRVCWATTLMFIVSIVVNVLVNRYLGASPYPDFEYTFDLVYSDVVFRFLSDINI